MFFPDHGHKFDISIYYFCFEGGGWTEGVDGVGMVADPEQDWTGGGGGGGHGGKIRIDSFTEQCQVPHTGTQPFLVWHLKKKKMLALEKEKMWDNFQRIIEHFTQKIVKIWSWDPGSGRRNKPIPDPGVKKASDPGAVLSLTVDKVIQSSLFQAPALSRDGSRAGSNSQQYPHSRQVRFFFATRKELGKGGGSGIRVPVYLV
jgi:hypothetical protein